MKNLPLLLVTVLGSLALIVGIAVFFSRPITSTVKIADQQELVGENPHAKGAASAKVTVVILSDFQCPACRAVQPIVQQLISASPDSVRIVYRHFPLSSIHQFAQLAAQASEVAAEDNKFWEYHDLLFEKQDEWSKLGSISEAKERFAEYAQQIGIDKVTFLSRIDSDEVHAKVLEDITLGGKLQLNSTPSFFVNGQPAAPGAQLIQLVNEQLQAS